MKKQGYVLRYYLPLPPHFDKSYTDKRFDELLSLCKRCSIESVMFYVALDPSWYYISDSVEYSRSCRDLMLPYIRRLRAEGISYQLNFQNLVGSTLGGVDFSANFGWENLVDHRGRESLGCGCPIGDRFRKQAGERLRIWAETEPDVIWIDDDLRYHNHGTPILAKNEGGSVYKDYYCFCDRHIALFNEKHKTSFDRKSLIREMTKQGEPSSARRDYLNFLGETICDTAIWIRNTVQSVSPKTRLAQMTSNPDVHSAEGRPWSDFLKALCGEYTPITRATFGPYCEAVPRDLVSCYAKLAQSISQIRETYGGSLSVCPEVENTRFTVWSKSASATAMQLSLSAFMGCSDITLSLYDLDGGSFSDEPAYERMLINEKPRLDSLFLLGLFDRECGGVIIPTSENSGINYHLSEGEDYEAIGGKSRYIDKYLLKMGIPCRYLPPNRIDTGLVALDGYSAGFLSDDEIKKVLSKAVFIDADAALALLNRGFGELIGISSMTKQTIFANAEIYKERLREDGTYVRIPSRIPSGNWYIPNLLNGTRTLSEFLAPNGNISPALSLFENSLGGKVLLYPACRDLGDGFFTHHRVRALKDIFSELDNSLPRLDCASYALYVVKKVTEDTSYHFIANLSPDTLENVKINGVTQECQLGIYGSAVFCENDGSIKRII